MKVAVSGSHMFTELINMVTVPHLHEMKYSETRQSAKIIESTKHWKTDSDVNFQLIIDK